MTKEQLTMTEEQLKRLNDMIAQASGRAFRGGVPLKDEKLEVNGKMEVDKMQVNRSDIQKAFAVAHRLAENASVPARERNYFRAIAHLIWRSCGTENS